MNKKYLKYSLLALIPFLIIIGIVIFNSIMGVIQEAKAEKSIEALQKMTAPTAKVKREGKIKEIETRVNSIGYFFEKDIKDEDFISYILSMIEDTNDLGARPIEHKLQELMVDKICDKIINNDIKIGEFFKKTDFITT